MTDQADNVPMLSGIELSDIDQLEVANAIETNTKRGCFGSIRYAIQRLSKLSIYFLLFVILTFTPHFPDDKALWIVFLDYFLSSWSDRMWSFAVPILFVELLSKNNQDHQDDSVLLLPASIFALGLCLLTKICFHINKAICFRKQRKTPPKINLIQHLKLLVFSLDRPLVNGLIERIGEKLL
jgi:hypothetical protein